MVKWLLCGAAIISGIVIAAEPENRSFQFGNFEVIAVQDALSAMRFKLFPGMLEEEFLRLTGGGRVPSSVNVFLLKRGDGKIILVDAGNGGKRGGMLRKLEQSGVFRRASISFYSPICTATTSEDCLGNMAKPFFQSPRLCFHAGMGILAKWYGRTTGKTGPEGVAFLRQPGENIPVWRRSSARHQGF